MDIANNYSLERRAILSQRQAPGSSNSFYTVTDLRQRGWTRRLIERFLGYADTLTPNPHFKRGRPMKFFDTDRVHGVECLSMFEEETLASHQRKQAGQRVIEDKRHALTDLAAAVEPVLPDWTTDELNAQAREMFGFTNDDVAFRRAQVSALMRHCSACEWPLDDYFWHPGIRAARVVMRRKSLAKIMSAYPHLSDQALEWAKKEKGNAQIDIFLE